MNKGAVIYSPIWPQYLVDLRLKSGKAVFTEIGRELMCGKCKEYWPSDTQFFHSQPSQKDGLCCWCKACYSLNDKQRRQRDKDKKRH